MPRSRARDARPAAARETVSNVQKTRIWYIHIFILVVVLLPPPPDNDLQVQIAWRDVGYFFNMVEN